MSRGKSGCGGKGMKSRFLTALGMISLLALVLAFPAASPAQQPESRQPNAESLFLSHLNAGPNDPLYTTYAAPLSRSEYFVDEGYHLNYYSPELGVTWSTQKAGDMALAWRLGKMAVAATRDFYRRPVVHRSYTDLAEVEYWS